jgi:glutathione S-transferase
MADELVFYTNPMSRGRTVRWMLEEVGQPYRTEIVDFGPPMKNASYTAVNPMGKVPALTHCGVVVTEVAAILSYLADAFPAAKLAPATSDPARGNYYRWIYFCCGPLEYAVSNRSFGFVVPQDQRGRIGYGSYDDVMNTIEQTVAGAEFLAGGRFSAADLYLSAMLGWGMMTGGIDKRKAFETYVARHVSRPAALKARAIDDALMKPASP